MPPRLADAGSRGDSPVKTQRISKEPTAVRSSRVQGWTQSPRSMSSDSEQKKEQVAFLKAKASRPQPRPKQPLNPRQNPDSRRTVVISVKNWHEKPLRQKSRDSPDLASFNGDHRSTLDPRDIAPSRIFEEALDGGQSLAKVATLANNGSNPIKIPHVEAVDSPADEACTTALAGCSDFPKIKTQHGESKDADPRGQNPFSVTQRTLAIKSHKFNYDCFTMQNSGSSTSLGSQE